MIINIASFGGRSHLLDTARELAKHGHVVRFYSYVPTKRCLKFGLLKENCFSYFWLAVPFMFIAKVTRSKWPNEFYYTVFDRFLAWFMKPCDVFIGHSPMHLYSFQYMKKKYNAITILERGTSHIKVQERVELQSPRFRNCSKGPFSNRVIRKELSRYEIVDYISVGANHVKESLVVNDIDEKKIFVNQYGANLSFFGPTVLEPLHYDVIVVGQWSFRKGVDLLIEACTDLNLSLLHVGAIIDIPFPSIPNFKHIAPVNESELKKYYAKAKVFALPSREEGLALVQPQALSCGLPIVCSPKTGGRDLKQFIKDTSFIIEMKDISVNSLKEGLVIAITKAEQQTGVRVIIDKSETGISWQAYGDRYDKFLHNIKRNRL